VRRPKWHLSVMMRLCARHPGAPRAEREHEQGAKGLISDRRGRGRWSVSLRPVPGAEHPGKGVSKMWGASRGYPCLPRLLPGCGRSAAPRQRLVSS
jgi:hypothetical protein